MERIKDWKPASALKPRLVCNSSWFWAVEMQYLERISITCLNCYVANIFGKESSSLLLLINSKGYKTYVTLPRLNKPSFYHVIYFISKWEYFESETACFWMCAHTDLRLFVPDEPITFLSARGFMFTFPLSYSLTCSLLCYTDNNSKNNGSFALCTLCSSVFFLLPLLGLMVVKDVKLCLTAQCFPTHGVYSCGPLKYIDDNPSIFAHPF